MCFILGRKPNYFTNRKLASYDHAALLLALGQLHAGATHALFVQHMEMPPWYQALWRNWPLLIVSLGCGMLVLFWRALSRFGPLLPEPVQERRSLLEHIDASGRWLWKVPGGRDLQLAAARHAANAALTRRAPELQRLRDDTLVTRLAQATRLPAADLAQALQQPAATTPVEFTQQVKTLQQLRKHYER